VFEARATNSEDVLRGLPAGVALTARDVLEGELAVGVIRGWHTYFFEGPLSIQAQQLFVRDIAGFFERLESSLIDAGAERLIRWGFPFEARCAEFEALIPVGDPSWVLAYRKASIAFSRNVQRIVSFQGCRFVD
jgi:hypothetical protein